MEVPPPGNEKFINYNKTNAYNKKYSFCMKIKDQNSIDISIAFENGKNTYEECKLYEDIKKEQPYFEDHTIDEAFDVISDLISKDSIEFDNKNEGTIQLNIILPSEERKSLNFVLHQKNQNQSIDSSLISKSIKTKDETIKNNDENIKPNDEDIKEDKNIENKINEEKLEEEEIGDKVSFAENIDIFSNQTKRKESSEVQNNTKEERINQIIYSKDLSENEKNIIINEILNESKDNSNYQINSKDKDSLNLNVKMKENESSGEKEIEENNIEKISNKPQNMKENQKVMVYDSNEIIIANNLAQINSSERHYQINMINNQPQQISTYESKCPYFCCKCHFSGYYCDKCLSHFCFYCYYNSNCLKDCCNQCCRCLCKECCKSFYKCLCEDCCGVICKKLCDCFCDCLCEGICSHCQIF